jgi:acid stress chaperone HdeB
MESMVTERSVIIGRRIVANLRSIIAGLFFCLVIIVPAGAQIAIDMSKITCKEYTLDTITLSDNIAYWLNGYYNGRRGNTVLNDLALRDYVYKVTNYCASHQDSPVMKAAEAVLNSKE